MNQAQFTVEKIRANYISLRKKYVSLFDPMTSFLDNMASSDDVINIRKLHSDHSVMILKERDELDDVQYDLLAISSKTMDCYTSIFKKYIKLITLILQFVGKLPGSPEVTALVEFYVPESQTEIKEWNELTK